MNEIMRPFFYITLLLLLFTSCKNSNNRQTFPINNHTTPSNPTSTDSIQDDIPRGYTRHAFHEYVPQNDVEKKFLSDMHSFQEALNSRNSQKVVELYYPDYFVILHKQVPEMSIKQLRKALRKHYEEIFDEILKSYTKKWGKAKKAGVCITNIMNRVYEKGKILYLYEYHTTLSSDEETIYKEEAEYSVGASLNNGKQWYSSAENLDDLFEILGVSFSYSSIDKVLTK